MKMCYVDESGDTGPFDPGERNSQPIFLLCALMLAESTSLKARTLASTRFSFSATRLRKRKSVGDLMKYFSAKWNTCRMSFAILIL